MNKKDKKTEEFFETGRKLAEKFQEIERIPRHKIDKEFDILMSKYDKITCRKRKINMAIYFSAAASFVLLLTYMFFIKNSNHINSFDSFANEKSVADSSRILITDNNSYFNIDKDAVITYDKTGNVFVKSPGADEEANEIQLKSDTCSIFVPYGQIAKLMLSDNSEVTLNAGSHITFPKVFNSSRREVNLEGEAFFNVSHNDTLPFIVNADNFSITVLGTVFNVSTDENENYGSVILVDGSVLVNNNDNHIKLSPSEKADIFDDNIKVDVVSVDEYICWKEKIIYLDNRNINDIFKELSHYYNLDITYNNDDNIVLSGKLELNDDYKKTFEVLSITFSLQYKNQGDKIIFYKK